MGVQSTVPVEELRAAGYGDEVETVGTAVAEYLGDGTGTTIAVVSDAYGGRDAILEYAASLLDGGDADETPGAETVRLDSIVTGDPPSIPEDRALVLYDAQQLFHRGVGGFEALATFLDRLALSDTLVVTAWNRHAWRYLDAVRDLGDSFSELVEIPPLSAAEVEAVIDAHADTDAVEFVDTGAAGRIKTLVFGRYTLGMPGGRQVAIPYPKPNPAWVQAWREEDDQDSIEAVVYEKIRRVSHGNPGVATTVWEESVRNGTGEGADTDEGETGDESDTDHTGGTQIAPAFVRAPGLELDLDDDEAFLLWNVLAHESIDRSHLADLVGEQAVNTDLQRLVDRNLVTVADGRARVAPLALHSAVEALARRQLLW